MRRKNHLEKKRHPWGGYEEPPDPSGYIKEFPWDWIRIYCRMTFMMRPANEFMI